MLHIEKWLFSFFGNIFITPTYIWLKLGNNVDIDVTKRVSSKNWKYKYPPGNIIDKNVTLLPNYLQVYLR